jgi:hypothetical protein
MTSKKYCPWHQWAHGNSLSLSKPASTTGTLFHTSKGLMATPRATLVMTRRFSPGKRNHGFRKAIICGHTRQYRRLGGWARLIAAN